MCGLARLFADGPMTFRWQNERIRLPEIAITEGAFAIISWQRLPQTTTGLGRAIAKGQSNDATCLPGESQPYPDNVAFMADKRPKFIKLQDRTLNQWCGSSLHLVSGLFVRIVATVLRLI